jgi:hypothetical protein
MPDPNPAIQVAILLEHNFYAGKVHTELAVAHYKAART